jgi:cell wall-associated NlpC family hydrolase
MNLRLSSMKIYTKIIGGILLAGAIFIGNPQSAEAALGDRTLKQGMNHNEVKELQIALKRTKHFTYPSYTSYFGTYTKTAVSKFQKENKLHVTGVADPKTIALIKKKAFPITSHSTVKVVNHVTKIASVKSFDVNLTKRLAGVRYTWGGTTPKTGFDCSGFVTYVMNQHGVSLPRSSSAMFSSRRVISLSSIRPGDLLYYDTNNNGRKDVSHVAIYIGNNMMIHSASKKVEYDSLNNAWWSKRFVGANRVL